MLRFALRRFYFGLISLLLFTALIFGAVRVETHNLTYCDVEPNACDMAPHSSPLLLIRNGPLYAVWQTGTPPQDYWPLAVALLAAGGAVEVVTIVRTARRSIWG
jgi:hypothetical protein